MGLDLTYRCRDREFSVRFSHADWDTLMRVEPYLSQAIRDLAHVPDFDAEEPIPTDRLRAAVEELDAFLRDRADLLPHTYQFRCEYIPVGPPESVVRYPGGDFSTGGMSGFRLPGDDEYTYRLTAGLDKCELTTIAIGADGMGKFVEVRDLRGESELQTSNCGRVEIRRRRAKTSLRKDLAEIRRFLSSVDGPEVIKILC